MYCAIADRHNTDIEFVIRDNIVVDILLDVTFVFCSQTRLPDAVSGAVHSMPALDTQWIETTSKKMALKLEKLDTDLKNYKSNSIKESIRYVFCTDLFLELKLSQFNVIPLNIVLLQYC